jgi:hypothetical protein
MITMTPHDPNPHTMTSSAPGQTAGHMVIMVLL